jgi:purine nucleoside phosphorylase
VAIAGGEYHSVALVGSVPWIITPPQSQTVVQGSNAMFSVVADGTAPLSYQWQFNGTNLAGGGAGTLTLANVQPEQAGGYAVVVTNAWGSVTSAVASLTVVVPPSIITPPQSQTVVQGSNAMFSAVASGTAPLSYQWQFNGTNLAGAGTDTLTLASVEPEEAGGYAVVVTNTWGSVTSAVASLTVVVPPSIITPPQSQTVMQGSNATFSVVAGGTAPLSYQWQFNGTNLAGAGTDTLTLASVQPEQAGSYAVVVTNAWGSVTSAVASLTVLVPPSILSPPQSQTVVQGSNATFSVVADGTAPLSYQWNFEGAIMVGTTNAVLTLTNVQSGEAGSYSVTVSNAVGATNSAAVLTVISQPALGLPCMNGDGTFSFMLSGDLGCNYVIEVTTDWVSWTALTTLSNATGQVPFTDTNAPGSAVSFYRARLLP